MGDAIPPGTPVRIFMGVVVVLVNCGLWINPSTKLA